MGQCRCLFAFHKLQIRLMRRQCLRLHECSGVHCCARALLCLWTGVHRPTAKNVLQVAWVAQSTMNSART